MTEEVAQTTRAGRLEKASILAETMEDGRYIPYGGGIMGWFENQGVLRSELPNNYGFHTVIDAKSVRQKLIERWGTGDSSNRRVTKRFGVEGSIPVSLAWEGNKIVALGKDFSSYGLKLQIQQ